MNLHVALCQFSMAWEAVDANLRRAEGLISRCGADLVVLPEMFATGFVTDPRRVVQEADGPVVDWMRTTAQCSGKALAGSVILRHGDRCVNRLLFVRPTGEMEYYDKRHLFSIGGEGVHFVAGERRVVVEYRGWRLLLLICYDLRFPVWSRCRGDYDAILCVASWPEPRREVWRTLLRARAIENEAYVVGVNRTGHDPENRYVGDSAVIDFRGRSLAEMGAGEGIAEATLDREALDRFRERFPVWRDADDFVLR